MIRTPLPWLSPDGHRIFAGRALRTFGYGIVSVVLGVHVADLGLGGLQLGLLLGAAYVGSSVLTTLIAMYGDRLGRRTTLRVFAALMTVTGTAYAMSDQFWLLVLVSLSGTIGAGIQEMGPFLSLEQAALPQTAPDTRRTRLFTLYNLIGIGAAAAGALFAGLMAAYGGHAGMEPLAIHRVLFGVYAAMGFATLLLYLRMSEALEQQAPSNGTSRLGLHKSRGIIVRMAILFGVDSFGGGLSVQSIMAFWFVMRFGLGLEALGPLFAASNLLSALSLLAAERIAARIGLLNTMVWTHIPSSIAVILVAISPTPELAILFLLIRASLAQMDVPTRQSYLMAVVDPSERTAAAGLTIVGRNIAQAIAPPIGGLALQSPLIGLPLILTGVIKIFYDLALWRIFRSVKPPEEITRAS